MEFPTLDQRLCPAGALACWRLLGGHPFSSRPPFGKARHLRTGLVLHLNRRPRKFDPLTHPLCLAGEWRVFGRCRAGFATGDLRMGPIGSTSLIPSSRSRRVQFGTHPGNTHPANPSRLTPGGGSNVGRSGPHDSRSGPQRSPRQSGFTTIGPPFEHPTVDRRRLATAHPHRTGGQSMGRSPDGARDRRIRFQASRSGRTGGRSQRTVQAIARGSIIGCLAGRPSHVGGDEHSPGAW